MPAAYLNPTTSRSNVLPAWFGPILSTNTMLGTPTTLLDPNSRPSIRTPAAIFPSAINYRQVVISALNMLFGTRQGERLWLPTFGLNMEAMVFEVLDIQTTQTAQNAIRTAISTWEPRVNVLQVGVAPDPNNNAMTIQVVLQLVGAPPDDVWTYSTTYTPPA